MKLDTVIQNLPALFCALLAAILFIQSGLDKVFDFTGNLEWLKGHFSKTFLRGMVLPMVVTITVMELATGFFAVAGMIYFLFTGSLLLIFFASILGAVSITALFFGQRVAKDYPGAAVLVPYFILLIILMLLTSPKFLDVVY
jgi:hypothetical protein